MASAATALDAQVTTGIQSGLITSNATSGVITCVIWVNWNQVYTVDTASATQSIVYSPSVWPAWNQAYTATASNIITTRYVVTTAANDTAWLQWNGGLVLRQENEQQRLAREQQEREFEARLKAESAEIIARQREAYARARELLIRHLTLKQREQLEKEKVFEVLGKSGKHRYLIGEQGDVKRIDEKGPVESYCIHPPWQPKNLPPADLALAKKLMLEFDEDLFLKTANKTRLRA